MTVDEFLTQNKSIFKVMVMHGLSLDLGRCAGMVEMYEKAKAEYGSKCAARLCMDRYCIRCRANFYRILQILKQTI